MAQVVYFFTEYNIARMEEVEITSEFFIMMLKGVIAKTQNAIDNAYAEYDENLPERDELGKKDLGIRCRQLKLGSAIQLG
ncbi:hypothetical protein ACFS07_04025 [Undibacterium arcticum]